MLREDASESSVERSSQLSRVRDSTMTLFQQYSELLRCSVLAVRLTSR